MIHVWQMYCMHFCHCGFGHISKDQVDDHQKTTNHSHDKKGQYQKFCEHMEWSTDKPFGELLLQSTIPRATADSQPEMFKRPNWSKVASRPKLTVSARCMTRNQRTRTMGIAPLRLTSGYQKPRTEVVKEQGSTKDLIEQVKEFPQPGVEISVTNSAIVDTTFTWIKWLNIKTRILTWTTIRAHLWCSR